MSKLTYFSALPVELIQHIIQFMPEDEGVSFTLHFTTLKPQTITRFYSFLSGEELFFSVHCLNELTLLYMKYNVNCVSSLVNVYSTIIFNRPEFIPFFRPLIETSEAKRRDYVFGPLITKLAKNGLLYREYISIDSQRFNRLTLLGAISGNQVELMHTYLNNNTDYNDCLPYAVDHPNLIKFFIQKGATSYTNAGCHLVQSENTGIEYKKEFIKLFVEKGADIDEIASVVILCKNRYHHRYNDMKSLIDHIFETYDNDYLRTLLEIMICDDLEYFKLCEFDTLNQLALSAVRNGAKNILKYCIEQGATNYDELTKKILSEDHFYLCDEHVKVYGEQALEDTMNLRNSDIVKKVYKKYQGDLSDNYLLCLAIKNDLSDVELFYDKCSDYLDPLREAIFKRRDDLVLRMIHKCSIYDIFDYNMGQSSYIPLEHSEYLVNLVINNTNIRFDREKLETILNQHYY